MSTRKSVSFNHTVIGTARQRGREREDACVRHVNKRVLVGGEIWKEASSVYKFKESSRGNERERERELKRKRERESARERERELKKAQERESKRKDVRTCDTVIHRNNRNFPQLRESSHGNGHGTQWSSNARSFGIGHCRDILPPPPRPHTYTHTTATAYANTHKHKRVRERERRRERAKRYIYIYIYRVRRNEKPT
jgi:hypothetical protein